MQVCVLMIVRQSTQTLLTRVPETTMGEFDQAVDAASQAFKSWSKQSALSRQRFAIEYVPDYPPLPIPKPLTPHLHSDFSTKSVRMQMRLHTASSSSRARPLLVSVLFPLAKFTPIFPSADAHGDVLRGLQVVETAIGVTSNLLGEKLEGAYAA